MMKEPSQDGTLAFYLFEQTRTYDIKVRVASLVRSYYLIIDVPEYNPWDFVC